MHDKNKHKPSAPNDAAVKDPKSEITRLQKQLARLSHLIALEAEVRNVTDLTALEFLIANETSKFLPARQVMAWSAQKGKPASLRIKALSSLSRADPNAPMTQWLSRELARGILANKPDKPVRFKLVADSEDASYPYLHAAAISFETGKDHLAGFCLLGNSFPGKEYDGMIERLAEIFSQQWKVLGTVRPSLTKFKHKKFVFGGAILALLLLAIPVPMAVIGKAEVVPRDPLLVTAPMVGVVDEIAVAPNTPVRFGDLLFTLQKTDLENQFTLATRELELATAKYRRAAQASFGEGEGKRELGLLEIERRLAEVRLAHAQQQLKDATITADRDGVVLFNTADDWLGKPVKTGETIMQIANPDDFEIKVELAPSDALALNENSSIEYFSAIDPLNPIVATFSHRNYRATPSPQGTMVYEVNAIPQKGTEPLKNRLGERGTARLSSEYVLLAYYLFRRPLAALRQFIGIW